MHKPSCAARIRASAEANGLSVASVAAAIVECCAVSRLRGHRLARGWTLREAVDELIKMCDELNLSRPSIDPDQLGAWEKARTPRAQTIDLLCRLYETDAQGLGMAGSYQFGAPVISMALPAFPPVSTILPVPPRSDTLASSGAAVPGDELFDSYRRAVESTLARTTATAGQLEVFDERIRDLRRAYVVAPPAEILVQLLRNLEAVRLFADERQPAGVQVRLSEMIAVLSTLVADALMKLGRLDQAQMWYGTARSAADDSGNGELRARVRVQAAMLPYYYGPLDRAASLTREARLLNRGRPTVTGAFAAAAEARVRARQGDKDGARAAIRLARELFDRCGQTTVEADAWAFPLRRLLLYLSGAYTFLGDIADAQRVQNEALLLYPDHTGIDPALLHLEQAMCLVHEHSVTEACQLASRTYRTVPEAHRTEILGVRALEIIKIMPEQVRSSRAVRELGEALALPVGST